MKLSDEAKQYWKAFGVKCLENMASVKVWFFMFPFIVSTIIMGVLVGFHLDFMKTALEAITDDPDKLVPVIQQMEIIATMFIAWCTFTVSLGGMVIVVREVFKVSKLKALNEEEADNSEHIKNMNA